jgi:hypothetical protein
MEDKIIPAGQEIPAEVVETVAQPAAAPVVTDTPVRQLAGKYDTPEALEAAYTELQTAYGKQGGEVGDMRKSLEQMQTEIGALQPQVPAGPTAEEQRVALAQQLDDGDIVLSEFMAQTQELDRGEREAERAQWDQQRSAQDMNNQFVEQNPQYMEMDQAGALDEYVAQNPMHDKFSAYYALQAQQSQTATEQAVAAAREEGKAEGLKLAKGAEAASKVISKPGAAPPTKTGPVSEPDRKQRMLSALSSARGE